jgi:hypothetical protein
MRPCCVLATLPIRSAGAGESVAWTPQKVQRQGMGIRRNLKTGHE